ncbi:Glycosyltransferase family 52 [Paramixta manurensis]|uniref:Glycosyltransferase family 52 n=1 Tax=Paramixta manurensis TaxID=2740817 RepID=A0A6M8UAM5_9GAMM|nr:Glycosyltransferase family 52 [Erwiniaceae bacterium PD-1]
MNVFVCRTIFQAYYADIIIKRKELSDIIFIYLADGFSERERSVLSCLSVTCHIVDGASQFSRLWSQLKTLLFLRKKIKKYNGKKNIYFASIDDLFIQTILSCFHFDGIYTFDDGTANYVDKSIFYVPEVMPKTIKLKYRLMGNRIKDIQEVKSIIDIHFSSNHLPNILEETEYLPLIDVNAWNSGNFEWRPLINIYLCPHFDEVYCEADIVRQNFLSMLSAQDIVIPHPRDKFLWKENEHYTLLGDVLAEKKISELLIQGYRVNLFGIANSTQYHFIDVDLVKNNVLVLGKLKEKYCNAIQKQIDLFKILAKLE